MANEEHLRILKQGVEVWNAWREHNKIERPDLSDADLHGANLSYANLSHADLHFANFSDTDLNDADLSRADLTLTDLSNANLSNANLSNAEVELTNFSYAKLINASFTDARCVDTIFADVDLSQVKGLDTIKHRGPSTIGIDTLFKSKGKIPDAFLRGCGVPENLISSLPILMEGKELTTAQNSIFGTPIGHRNLQCDIFMIMPFAEAFQPIYEDHIKPVAEGLRQTIKRGDNFFGKTSIMTDIWSAINNAKLVIAECTGRNPNVFYEMGIAHSLDKPVIMLTQNMEDIPFDLRHLRVIKYDFTPRGTATLEEKLTLAIKNLLEE